MQGIGSNTDVTILGFGSIYLKIGVVRNVQYAPKATCSVLSESVMAKHGIKIITEDNVKRFYRKSKLLATGYLQDTLYMINFELDSKETWALKAGTMEEWHHKMAHINPKTIERMNKLDVVDGLEITQKQMRQCESCAACKCTSASHPARDSLINRAKEPGLSLHMDTQGPNSASFGGSKYTLLCKDEYSAFRMVSFIAEKSQIANKVKAMVAEAKIATGNDVVQLVTDDGSEFKSSELADWLAEKGIIRVISAAYTPQQNGYIERDFRTINQLTRTMLKHAKLPQELWTEAVSTVLYVLNRTINKTNRVPFELWYGSKPDISNFKLFGQRAMVMWKTGKKKYGEQSTKLIFVGYTKKSNTFRFYDHETQSIRISCDATFLYPEEGYVQIERCDWDDIYDEMDYTGMVSDVTGVAFEDVADNVTRDMVKAHALEEEAEQIQRAKSIALIPIKSPKPIERQKVNHLTQRDHTIGMHRAAEEEPIYGNITVRGRSDTLTKSSTADETFSLAAAGRSSNQNNTLNISEDNRPIRPSITGKFFDERMITGDQKSEMNQLAVPKNLHIQGVAPEVTSERLRKQTRKNYSNPYLHSMLTTIAVNEDPSTYSEAMSGQDSEEWWSAMHDEIDSMVKNQVFTLVDRPKQNVVGSRWVFVTKMKPTGDVDRHKARLVARGFSQIHGIDYSETFAPVVDSTTIRLLFAYSAVRKLEMGQFDVKTAFLYGELEEEIYMEQSPGFETGNNKVWKLKKSIYGLKQAPRQWNRKFTKV